MCVYIYMHMYMCVHNATCTIHKYTCFTPAGFHVQSCEHLLANSNPCSSATATFHLGSGIFGNWWQ